MTQQLSLLFASALLTFSFQTSAHADFDERLEQRLHRQSERIDYGIDDGSLTHNEQKVLNKQQRRLVKLSNRFLRDDHYSRKERRILQQKLNNASEQIRQFRHNNATSYRNDDNHYYYTSSNAPYSSVTRQTIVYRNSDHHRPVAKRCNTKRYYSTTGSRRHTSSHYSPTRSLSISW